MTNKFKGERERAQRRKMRRIHLYIALAAGAFLFWLTGPDFHALAKGVSEAAAAAAFIEALGL